MSTSHLAHHLTVENLEREDLARELGPNSIWEAGRHARLTGHRPKHLAEPAPTSGADEAMRDVDTWAVATAVTDESGRAA